MVKMGDVWDRTTDVLSGRGAMLAGIAVPTLYLPSIASAALAAYADPTGATYFRSMVSLLVAVLAIWGQLALTAAASDPATDRGEAWRRSRARLGAGIGVAVLLTLVLFVALLPMIGLLAHAGVDMAAMTTPGANMAMTGGIAVMVGLYGLAFGIVLLFVGARLVPLYPAVVHERRGFGVLARTWRLTRRHSWRIVGTVLLFFIVLTVATLAAQSVTGLVARLILGGDALATAAFIAAVVSSAVSTALSVVAIVFSAQLYMALVAQERPVA